MSSGLKSWLKDLVLVFVLPLEKYYAGDMELSRYRRLFASPVLSLGFATPCFVFMSRYGMEVAAVSFIPLSYIAASVGIRVYGMFVHVVLWFMGVEEHREVSKIAVHVSPFLLPCFLLLYFPFAGFVLMFLALSYHHYLIARALNRYRNVKPERAYGIMKRLMMAECLVFAVAVFLYL